MRNYYPILNLLLLWLMAAPMTAQKVLQIERFGRADTEKIFIGEGIEYRLKGEKDWRYAVIEDIQVEEKLLVFADRYLDPEKIDALRYYRPGIRRLGFQMMTFGVAWSGFALIGTAVDGDPETSYRISDAVVTATSIGLGFAVMHLFKYKKIRFGKRRRLRIVDIRF